jgi:hypothetical protein
MDHSEFRETVDKEREKAGAQADAEASAEADVQADAEEMLAALRLSIAP